MVLFFPITAQAARCSSLVGAPTNTQELLSAFMVNGFSHVQLVALSRVARFGQEMGLGVSTTHAVRRLLKVNPFLQVQLVAFVFHSPFFTVLHPFFKMAIVLVGMSGVAAGLAVGMAGFGVVHTLVPPDALGHWQDLRKAS